MSMHPNPTVYNGTTEPVEGKSGLCTSGLSPIRLLLKVLQLLFSLVAFISEEIIQQCENCAGLYFFEFVSCSATILTFLQFIVYLTPLQRKMNIEKYNSIDYWMTLAVGILFLVASIVFAATMDNETLPKVSVAFGFLASVAFLFEFGFVKYGKVCQIKRKAPVGGVGAEGQPLNTTNQAQGQQNQAI